MVFQRVTCSSRAALAGGLISFAVVLAGCGAKSDAELIVSAKSSLAQGDSKSAVVDLKAALQKNGQAAEARFLLGKVLLDSGDPSGALIELTKAREAAFDENRLLPLLAQALFARGQLKAVVDQFGTTRLTDPAAQAELKAYIGMAAFFGGDRQLARAANEEALRLDPKNATARVQQARLAAARGAYDEAIAIVNSVTASDPKLVPAWMLMGELMAGGKKDAEAAAHAFRRVVELDPRRLAAHEWLIQLAEQRADSEAVKAQIKQLQKDAPHSDLALFYGAQLALMDNDIKRANELVQELLRVAPDSVRGLQLAGQVELRTGAYAQALKHLSQALRRSPQVPTLRYLVGVALLQTCRPTEALQDIKPLLDAKQPSADVLELAAQAHLQMGQLDEAMAHLRRASLADPQSMNARVMLALMEVRQGDAKAGLAKLAALAAADKGTAVDLALIRLLVSKHDIDAAAGASDRMLGKAPNDALAHLVRGQVLLLRNDRAGARSSFERALTLNPAYFTAVTELAAVDIADGNIAAADRRYTDFLKREPDNLRAQMALADLRERSAVKAGTVEALLREAVKAHPDEPAPKLALIGYYTRQRRMDDALQAAREAVAAIPADPQLVEALGMTQLAVGNSQEAVATLAKAAALSGTVSGYMRLAKVHSDMRDYSAATAALRKALEIAPQAVPVQRALIAVALADKRIPDALSIAQDVVRQRPREAIGFLMEAGIYAEQKSWDKAIAAAREAFGRERDSPTAIRLHALLTAGNRRADADAFAQLWRKEHPGDTSFQFHLGSMAMEQKDYATAEARYREVLATRPDNAVMLNDIAYLLLLQGKPGALPLAQQANRLSPGVPAYMDTLSRALAADKQPREALEWAGRAVAAAPDKPAYRLHLARLLIDTGDRTKAREELQKLAVLGGRFDGHREVARLLGGL